MDYNATAANQFLISLREQSLSRNDESLNTWTKYKEDVIETKSMLNWLPQKNSHKVMVPIGTKAFIPGKIVHTNEFLVNIGETWFVKSTANQAQEICDRRIEKCKEMIEKLDDERRLLIDKTSIPAEQDAFGSEERPEIIEEVTVEEDEEWRKQHRLKEKEYIQKLAEIKNSKKKPIETEQELWDHLDKLELQEELEDELNRLHASSEDEEEDEEDFMNIEEVSDVVTTTLKKNGIRQSSTNPLVVEEAVPNTSLTEVKPKRRVSFAAEGSDLSDDEPLHLEFHHSQTELKTKKDNLVITSPADIYDSYLEKLSKLSPISILKSNSNPNFQVELKAAKEADVTREMFCEPKYGRIGAGIEFLDVIERNTIEFKVEENVSDPPKKISKFKASRIKK